MAYHILATVKESDRLERFLAQQRLLMDLNRAFNYFIHRGCSCQCLLNSHRLGLFFAQEYLASHELQCLGF